MCTAFHRLRNLVWGTRFPGELGGAATRTLHNCYLQLLQEADQFYFQQPAGGQILPGASKGGDLPTPGKEAKERKKRDKEKKDRRERRDRDKSPGGEKKRKHKAVKEEDLDKAAASHKERKPRFRESSQPAPWPPFRSSC